MFIRNLLNALKYKIRGEVSTKQYKLTGMTIGHNFKRMQNCSMDISHCWLIEIGNNVTFAPNVKLIAHDASTIQITGHAKIGRISIGNNCFIGNGAMVLPGVSIGDNCIIGSGSIVTRDIPENTVAAGNPAKSICTRNEYTIKIKDEFSQASIFNESYTLKSKISKSKKDEMKKKLAENIGFCK
ncbi:DapH/DapD/GlmU-related protein [Pseudomonas fragi]|uniref:acyltransferase n=1 Tax=Pseudomonas fragi TaxID=296 RepID=UPI00309B922D